MAQTKKGEVKQAILDAAYKVFSEHGYTDANISDIAKLANVSPANVYVYFRSKLDILFAIYEPWLIKQFDDLELSLAPIRNSSKRLIKILSTLWRDIPSVDNGFANNMMQALSTTAAIEGYKPTLRLAAEKRLTRLLEQSLSKLGHKRSHDLASILFMAFDGYIVNFHLREHANCSVTQLKLLADILLFYESQGLKETRRRRSTPQRFAAVPSQLSSRARFAPTPRTR